ncbi:MFS transporter [Salmonella enterica subsp. enterica serovar Stanley]|nr:MFS transporter [Salmonella enterica subsp. enterica serovar Stanley]
MHNEIQAIHFQQKHKRKQVNNIAMITFWSQFASYTLNTVLILYLTMPLIQNGLGMSQAQAYAFIGVSQAMGYLMPMMGGFMADNILGLRRAILTGSLLLAAAYLLVMSGGVAVHIWGHIAFIAAYALIPVTNSLLMGTASALVSKIYKQDEGKAKGGMTLYYMSINVGALLATIISPSLIHSRYGPLSVFAVVFIGKALSALNFAYKYRLYEDVAEAIDKSRMDFKKWIKLTVYIVTVYIFTLFAYLTPQISSYIIGAGCIGGVLIFLLRTLPLKGTERTKQLVAVILIVVAILFFVMYNQMNTTMVLFAQNNSNLKLLGITVSPASYQMINPLSILLLGFVLPKFYNRFKRFTIPYQFSTGIILSGAGMLVLWLACMYSTRGIINGNYLVLTYFIITISELFVSALGLSMIGIYCSEKMVAFAMGAFYLASALSNIITGQLGKIVTLPAGHTAPLTSLPVWQSYYLGIGGIAIVIGLILLMGAVLLSGMMRRRGIHLA